jgi:hypothetical protein
MRLWILAISALLLVGCASAAVKSSAPESASSDPPLTTGSQADSGAIVPATQPPDLPNLGPAPELENEVWLNVDAPLRLANLRGQVVALDMWTFG